MLQMTSLAFVYVVLPVIMAVFLLVPAGWRPGAMLAASMGYCLLAAPGHLLLMVSCIAIDWAALLIMERYDHNSKVRLGCLIFSVAKNIAFILWYGALLGTGELADLPLGLQIYSLSAMSCIMETFRREVPYERSPVRFALYCCYFPRLVAGPLTPYADFAPQLRSLRPSFLQMAQGFGKFLEGAVKAGVLGGALQTLYVSLRGIPDADATVLSSWCTVFVLALSVYYRLAGCSVIAQGIGAMMGISLPQNFYYPYQSQSITDFFQRFNISVSTFFERNVYSVLKGYCGGPFTDSLNLLATGMLMGLWFGIRLNYLAWGAYLALFIILEKYVYPGPLERIPTFFRRVYSLCVVLSSFTIFGADSLSDGTATITRMFAFGSLPFFNDRLGYLLSSNWLLLAISLILSTSLVSLLMTFLRRHLSGLSAVISGAIGALLLAALTIFSL